MKDGAARVLAWGFDSIRIVEKLAALASYLRELGLHTTWTCLSRETQIALLAHDLPCIAAVDFLGESAALVAAGRALHARVQEDWDYDRISGRRITPLPGSDAEYPELQYRFYLGLWEQLMEEVRPALVLNLNGVPSAARALDRVAARRNVPVRYWENGLVPETLVMDPRGVNYNAHLAGERWSDPALSRPAPADIVRARTHRDRIVRASTTLLEEGHRPAPAALRRRLRIDPGQQIVLLPLQVDTDTNVICHSPMFGTMRELVTYAAAEVSRLEHHVLVVKEHPKRAPGGDPELRRLSSGGNARYVDDVNVTALLDVSDLVVTINSTVGFEALLRGTPVIALGRSVYSEKGLTRDLYAESGPAEGRLTAALSAARAPEPAELDRFLAYVFRHHLLHLDPADDPLDSRAAMASLFVHRPPTPPAGAARIPSASVAAALHRMRKSADQIRRLREGADRVVLVRRGESGLSSALAGKLEDRFPGCIVEMRESVPGLLSRHARPVFDLR
jgi:hypothetical protein